MKKEKEDEKRKIQEKTNNDKKHIFFDFFFYGKTNFARKLSLGNPSLYHFRVAGYLKSVMMNQRPLLYKNWSFPLRNSSVNVTEPAVSCGFGHKSLMGNFIFCAVLVDLHWPCRHRIST